MSSIRSLAVDPVGSKNLNLSYECINTALNDGSTVFNARAVGFHRLGREEFMYAHSSVDATRVLKYSMGNLSKIVYNSSTSGNITLYDGTSTDASVFANISVQSGKGPFSLDYNCPFYNGLTAVTDGTPDITFIYD
jgi:hypothetical protein